MPVVLTRTIVYPDLTKHPIFLTISDEKALTKEPEEMLVAAPTRKDRYVNAYKYMGVDEWCVLPLMLPDITSFKKFMFSVHYYGRSKGKKFSTKTMDNKLLIRRLR